MKAKNGNKGRKIRKTKLAKTSVKIIISIESWHHTGMSSGSGSGNLSSNPGGGEKY